VMENPIEVSMNNGIDRLWLSDNGNCDCEYLIELGDWAEIGLNESELDNLIEALQKLKNKIGVMMKEEFTKQEITDIAFLLKLRIQCLKHERPILSKHSIEHYENLLEKVRKM
jgi:hypothetical protein